jgi:formylglycine-generating enzyme required for sulfatase activity
MITLIHPTILLATPPAVTNVVASQRASTKLVDIYYDVQDADGDLLKVRVEISDNDGTLYSVPAFSMTGDIGEGIASGTGKHIIWNAGVDWDGEYSDKMRVKVFAVDAKGFPGMQWGNEVPPGGFLMGQDGGVEGSGPSRHVNIPWSCWLSKYEITIGQYCDFLNAALVAGFITRPDTTSVYSKSDATLFQGLQGTFLLLTIGDSSDIRWNVNNFETVNNRTNFPVRVTWYGALAFAHFYGYDLPTEAEWEKGARGPDHDDQDEHYIYTWGNTLTAGYANYYDSGDPWTSISPFTTSVGYYNGNQTPLGPDTANGYGLYDMVGNLSEWTLGLSSYAVETYPQQESIWSTNNMFIYSASSHVCKGGSLAIFSSLPDQLKLFYRYGQAPTTQDLTGFRVVRRNSSEIRQSARCEVFENFEAWPVLGGTSTIWTNTTTAGKWVGETYIYVRNDASAAASGSKYMITENMSRYLYLPQMTNQIVMVRLKIKNPLSNSRIIYLKYVSAPGSSSVSIPAYTTTYQTVVLPVSVPGKDCYLDFYALYVDDIEIWTVPAL